MRIRDARDRTRELQRMEDDDVIGAIAAVCRDRDAYLANVLATEALNRSQRTRAMISATSEGMLALDERGAITFMNRAAEQLLGIELAEAVKLDPADILRHQHADGTPAAYRGRIPG